MNEKTPSPENDDIFEIFEEISQELDSDILYINCSIESGLERLLINTVKSLKKKKNVILVLVTNGGSADVAFKMARCLQNNYERYSIFIPGWCKSAGTLIAVGAHTIYFSDHGELGPLDIQMGKKDELDGYVSGLDLDYGIKSLRVTAFSMFEYFMLQVINKSANRITFKTSAEIAASLTQAYINKFAEQVSPLSVGETVRMMTIAREYGQRLDSKYENVENDSALTELVSGYSSHSFVIDFAESKRLFKRVEWAPPALRRLEALLGDDYLSPFEGTTQDEMLAYLRGRDVDDDTTDGQITPESADEEPTGKASDGLPATLSGDGEVFAAPNGQADAGATPGAQGAQSSDQCG